MKKKIEEVKPKKNTNARPTVAVKKTFENKNVVENKIIKTGKPTDLQKSLMNSRITPSKKTSLSKFLKP